MLNMNYLGSSAVYPVEFNTISKNVVELKGNFPVLTDGFFLSRTDHEDNWDYRAYATVYREIDGGAQFSNDGSVYIEPEMSDSIPELTEDEMEEMQRKALEAQAIPTNEELSVAVMELAENIADIEDAVAELGKMI